MPMPTSTRTGRTWAVRAELFYLLFTYSKKQSKQERGIGITYQVERLRGITRPNTTLYLLHRTSSSGTSSLIHSV